MKPFLGIKDIQWYHARGGGGGVGQGSAMVL